MRHRYIQDPKSLKLIPLEDWQAPPRCNLEIMPDIQPYRSMIDGSIIGSRSTHRNHLRDHNMIEVGNEKLPEPKKPSSPPGLKDDIIRAFNQVIR
jgi:hypothetical protein